MTDWMAGLSVSKDVLKMVFVLCVVLTVGGLEFYRMWLGHGPREERKGRATVITAIVAIVFLTMLALGGGDIAARGRNFLNLTLALFGLAGLFIVTNLTWRFRRGLPLSDDEEAEKRRVSAQDL